jgi:tetratricopeptide (TPR) repeat protein
MAAGFAFAQNSAVNKADRYMNSGELDLAKEQIDLATEHEKTMDKGKTWFIRGQIYKQIAFSDNEAYQNLADEPFETAVESLRKVQEMENENSTYYLFADQALQEMWSLKLNEGAEAYQNGDYEAAVENFNSTKLIMPEDTTAYLYSGVAAMQAGMYEEAAENYYKLLELGHHPIDVYTGLIYIEKVQNEDMDKAFDLVQEAREYFPDNKDLMKEEIQMLIQTEKLDEARQKLESAIQSEPDNPNLYYSLAYLYDESDQDEKAQETYKKAIELNPDYFEANFNLAAHYFNKGVEILKEANNMNLEDYQKKGKEIIKQADKYFEMSVPYLEKAHNINPEDTQVIEILATAYEELKEEEKAEEYRKKLDDLGGNNSNSSSN